MSNNSPTFIRLEFLQIYLKERFISECEVCVAGSLLYMSFFAANVKSLTHLLTPRSRVLLEKLTGSQLVRKLPAFYGTRRFITACTSARHLSLYWGRSIQSILPNPTSCRSVLILFINYVWAFQVESFLQASPPKICTNLFYPPYVLHAQSISSLSIWSPAQYLVRSTDH